MVLNITEVNAELSNKSPQAIIAWALNQPGKAIVTTNFGPYEAVILHMATQVKPDIEVIWIDSGYNTADTYRIAEQLKEKFTLNVKIYIPQITAAHRNTVMKGIPSVDNPLHVVFTEQVKLEPFRRAMSEVKPDIWLTAIRKEQTPFRNSLQVVTQDDKRNLLKVAPVFHWTEAEMQAYIETHDLPNVAEYFDPTKVLDNRECGLHT